MFFNIKCGPNISAGSLSFSNRNLSRQQHFLDIKNFDPVECAMALIVISRNGFILPEQQVSISGKHDFFCTSGYVLEVNRRRIILELDGKIKYTNRNLETGVFSPRSFDKLMEMSRELVFRMRKKKLRLPAAIYNRLFSDRR